MTFNEIIKMYLEKQCQTDEALAAVYDESKVNGACDYIRVQAKAWRKAKRARRAA